MQNYIRFKIFYLSFNIINEVKNNAKILTYGLSCEGIEPALGIRYIERCLNHFADDSGQERAYIL